MLRIKNLAITGPLFLAPMAGYTDSPFRRIARRNGASCVFTELVSAEGLVRASRKTLELLQFTEEERPIGIQLFGGAPEIALSNRALKGNLMILAGNFFWAVYTVFTKPYLEKYSPLKLTALTMAIGTLFYLPITFRDVLRQPWGSLSARGWAALLFSAVFAIALSYFIWYSSVRRIGNTKTGIFGNITPVFTVFFAHLFLGERVTIPEVAGAVIIFLGFYLTRFGYRWFETRKSGLL